MIESSTLRGLEKDRLLERFARLVDEDRQNTATLVAYIAEIDRRKLYLEHACSSMFVFCTKRFGMSEAVAHRRIRAGRTTSRFPCILGMLARGELHLSAVHMLAAHLFEVFKRDGGCCTFVDSEGRRCGSTWQVEFHHIVPFALGGTHEPENLALRCRAHNRHEAELEYGRRFIEGKIARLWSG